MQQVTIELPIYFANIVTVHVLTLTHSRVTLTEFIPNRMVII